MRKTKILFLTELCRNALLRCFAPFSPISLAERLSVVSVYIKIRKINARKIKIPFLTMLFRNASLKYCAPRSPILL